MPSTRLEQVLAAGRARPYNGVKPTGMHAGGHAPHATSSRVVLKVAGKVAGIKPAKMMEGLEKIRALIRNAGVTTIVWDGDLLNYQKNNGSPAEMAFTSVFPVIQSEFPHLEWIYFKKEKSVGKLLASAALEEESEFKNVLGPYEFLTFTNTDMKHPNEPISLHPIPGQNYAIGFPNETSWKELGLLGLQWLKNVAKVESMHYFILGKGYVVSQELKAVAAHPELFPKGIAQEKRIVEFLGVEILNAAD